MPEPNTSVKPASGLPSPEQPAVPAAAPGTGAPVRIAHRPVPAPRTGAARLVKRSLWILLATALLVAIGLALRAKSMQIAPLM